MFEITSLFPHKIQGVKHLTPRMAHTGALGGDPKTAYYLATKMQTHRAGTRMAPFVPGRWGGGHALGCPSAELHLEQWKQN